MLKCAKADPDLPRMPTIADTVPLSEIMSRELTCVSRDTEANRVIELMLAHHIGCIPVVDAPGYPVGIITKLDLVEHLFSNENLSAQSAGHVMMPMAIALDEHATIAHAAALMAMEDIHHLFIVGSDGCLIGIVSTMDIVRWLARNDGFAPSSKL
jgi:CBS domain-containing protein